MSPRKPAVLRGGDGQDLREHLIVTAARLIEQRGSARLSVRDIAREAQVADGVLYNYFEDKEDLLAHALLAHVGGVMGGARPMPVAGIIGAVHGEILPRVLFHPPGTPIVIPPWYAERLSDTTMHGIAPRGREMIR